MNTSTSLVFPVARCDEKSMVRISAPWLDWKAVRTTTPKAAPCCGGCSERGCAPLECCSSLVPDSSRQARWVVRATRSSGRSPRLSSGALRCGVDSPCPRRGSSV